MDRFFKLTEKNTSVKTEVVAGITTFMTMAYILAVNPNILGDAMGSELKPAVFTATALASVIASVLMGLIANMPLVLSAGMGLNAYFAYSVVLGMGYSWKIALSAVFVEGVIFIVLAASPAFKALFDAIPRTLKTAVSVGIGIYIALIGLKSGGVVIPNESTLVSLFNIPQALKSGNSNGAAIAILTCLGIVITAVLVIKNVKGNILLGIFATWILGMLAEVAGIYRPDPAAGVFSVIPSRLFSAPQDVRPIFGACFEGFGEVSSVINFLVVLVAFLFVDIFDTLGTVIGCASKAKMLKDDGTLPKTREILLADALGTTAGAVLGTSTITTFVESAAGIAEGGRTGLTAIVSGAFFALALFLSPLFLAIPGFATAPALVVVGFLMMQQVGDIDWHDACEAIPAFFAIIMMPYCYSIAEGISFGIITYVIVNVAAGKAKKITPITFALAVLFVCKYFVL